MSVYHQAFWELIGFEFHRNSEFKRVARESNPMIGDPLGSFCMSSQKQNREGVVGAQSGQYRATVVERVRDVVDSGPGCDRLVLEPNPGRCADEVVGPLKGHEVFWELAGFGFHRNSEVKRVARESNPMIVDSLGSSRVSSQKQNREGVVRAQSGQYRATVVELARDVVDPGPGCDIKFIMIQTFRYNN
ncbi:unnamed protein product [Malus baccata var. baccata]